MILSRLEIELQRYGEMKGRHTGYAEFSGEAGKVNLNLTPELCDKIFMVCAEGIVSTAKEAAENLTCNVIEHRKSLTSAEDEG